MRDPGFVHLRVHTEYSLLEGAVRLKDLPRLACEMGMPAVAVTDTNAMFCALEFSVKALENGIQPIIGMQVALHYFSERDGEKQPPPAPLVLLAQNDRGYRNLMALTSRLYVDKRGAHPHATLQDLANHNEGLICLSGGPNGPVGMLLQQQNTDKAAALIDDLAQIYPNRLYIELQRHPDEDGRVSDAESKTESGLIEMAYAKDLPLVATNDVFFPSPEMFEAHDALICIAEGAYVDQQQPRRRLTPQHYLKTPAEMVALFADLPEAVKNTVEIAKRCAFAVARHDPILPKFAEDEVEELRRQSHAGLKERLAVISHSASVEEYENRLDFELGIIEQMGFPGYFLIVADFIKWAKDNDIPVGPGRGSGAGSLVAYALTITDLDPLRYSLLFERFLNPERVSMPDFDIDFCMDRREEVIQYVKEKYGSDRVGQIITFGGLWSKAAIRDVGRVLQIPYGQSDRLSKMIPMDGVKPVSLEKAMADEPRLREAAREEEVVARLFAYGQQLEGLLRNASTHAAGIVIGDRPLDTLVPMYQDPRSEMPATQFDMKWVEQAGLVKFDFLGLKTLTVIQNAVHLINEQGRHLHIRADGSALYEPAPGAVDQINSIPLDDETTFRLYASAKTVAVFQVESSGMMDALRRMKPTTIEDIVALVALYRPGPMENIGTYCDVKNGLRERASIHPLIDHILEETQGIIVYQEQVMQIAQEMAGYSLGGADLLRRAMGKKIKEAMDAERPKFEKGAAENGVDAQKATEVFDLLEKFANYGFNKSHAAAYAVVSYQTAWLKANHPVEFMAGVMNCDLHLTDKLSVYAEEVRRGLEIEIIPPCVNRSSPRFKVDNGRIVYALGALKNVGVDVMGLIADARVVDGVSKPYATVFDFARRVDLKRIGKRPLEMLARAGAFDQLDRNRRRIFDSLEALVSYSAAVHADRASAQVSLFGDGGDDLPEPRLSQAQDWLPAERLAQENLAIGFYLSGHPLDDYIGALRRKGVLTRDQVMQKAADGALVAKMAGTVAGRQERKSASGNRFAFAQLSDPSGLFEITLFSDILEKSRDYLENGSNVMLQVEATMETDQLKLLCRSIAPIDAALADMGAKAIKIFIDEGNAVESVASILERARSDARMRGKSEVVFCLLSPDLPGEVDITLSETYPVTAQIKGAIRSLPGVVMLEEF